MMIKDDKRIINGEEYLYIKPAAQFLNISPATLRSWIRKGHIKAHKLPTSPILFIKKSDMETFLTTTIEVKRGQ